MESKTEGAGLEELESHERVLHYGLNTIVKT